MNKNQCRSFSEKGLRLQRVVTNQFEDAESKNTFDLRGCPLLSEETATELIRAYCHFPSTLSFKNCDGITTHYIIYTDENVGASLRIKRLSDGKYCCRDGGWTSKAQNAVTLFKLFDALTFIKRMRGSSKVVIEVELPSHKKSELKISRDSLSAGSI